MAGDYTRFTFRPERDHAGVLMQQGRVQLDADWNEFVELIDRRLRAETVDIIGRCGVPRQTPTGFEITAPAGGGYLIGIGRAYVDGLLAENRGVGPLAFEPVWGEHVHTQPTPYLHQPYLDPAPAAPTGAGPHLFYLDVWERELTSVEKPDLVESAVGVDTATRLQSVWQVRTLENVGAGVTCASDWSKVQKWVDATRPSAGRLTTAAVGVTTPADPCLIEPTGGYRGVENRLYRVEIHNSGAAGGPPASFKWSRDNGAVAAVVESIDDPTGAPKVKVSRIGRDPVLRFRDGDWVELLDDILELGGSPGIMARIAPNGVDAAGNTITLDAALGGTIDTTRNARIRRWDQRAKVNANGVIPIGTLPATFELEDGVQVTFELDSAGGGFHVGDYWAFAARTADASVEILTKEPPRAIRHHYCRLAVLAGGKLEDCRVLYPPEIPERGGCDCDVCVTPKSHKAKTLTIQQAIDKVGSRGGKVCLAAGVYNLTAPIRIVGARSLTLVGKGHQTVLVHDAKAPAIEVSKSVEVTVRGLSVTTRKAKPTQRIPAVAILLSGTVGTTIERCFVGQATAITPKLVSQAAFHPGIGVGLNGFLAETIIRENVILADVGVGSATRDRPKKPGLKGAGRTKEGPIRAASQALATFFVTHGLFVEDNLLLCRRAGVDLGRAGKSKAAWTQVALLVHFGDTRIAGNSLYGCSEVGIVVTGLVLDALASSATSKVLMATKGPTSIDYGPFGVLGALVRAGASRLDIRANVLTVFGGQGIYVGSSDVRIVENDLTGTGSVLRGWGDGITLGRGARGAAVQRAQVLANRVRRFMGDGIVLSAYVRSSLVKQNIVAGVGGMGIVVPVGAELLTIENNEILDVGLMPLDEKASLFGIAVSDGQRMSVTDNRVAGVGTDAVTATSRVGIELLGCPDVVVTGNEISDVGPAEQFLGASIGIEISEGYDRIDVGDNTVRLSVGEGVSGAIALVVGTLQWLERLRAPRRGRAASTKYYYSTGAYSRGRELVLISAAGARAVQLDTGMLAVHGNHLETAGVRSTVEIQATGSCLFNDNRCRLIGGAVELQPAVAIIQAPSGSVIANANHLAGPRDTPAFLIDPAQNGGGIPLATVLGNVTDGPITLNGNPLAGTPWADLNITT
jgi:Family of unknown function (DUF6519)/Right handed beta helix region